MSSFIFRRILQSIAVLILITIFVFIVMHMLPSDPITMYLSSSDYKSLSSSELESMRHEFGLDKPLPVQYFNWISGVARGDFGESIILRQDVGQILAQHLPVSLYIGGIVLFLSALLGIFFGIICALKRGTWIDNLFTIIANIGITAPNFWVGILLIYFLAYKLGWLPIYGFVSPFDDLWGSIKSIIMPVICLTLFSTSILTRQTRSSMLEIIRQDYVRTAWSKGLTERALVWRHALKNAFIPVVTLLGMQVRVVVGGTVVIEQVFSIPGFGRVLVEAVQQQDYQLIQGGVLLIGILVLLVNLMVDISYGWFDPRIRYG